MAPSSPSSRETRQTVWTQRRHGKGNIEAYRGHSIKMKAADLKVDVFGTVAVATFLLDYSFETGSEQVRRQARSTLVFVKDHGAWKITHEHLSPVKASEGPAPQASAGERP